MAASDKRKQQKPQEHEHVGPERSAILRNPEIAAETYRRADEVHRAAERLHATIKKVENNVASMKARAAKRSPGTAVKLSDFEEPHNSRQK